MPSTPCRQTEGLFSHARWHGARTQRLNIYDTYHTGDVRGGLRDSGMVPAGMGPACDAGSCARSVTSRTAFSLLLSRDIVRRVGIVMSAIKPPQSQYGRDINHKSIECRHVTFIKRGPTYGTARGSYHYLASLTSTLSALSASLSHLSSRHGIVPTLAIDNLQFCLPRLPTVVVVDRSNT